MAARDGGEFNEIETVEEAVTFPISNNMAHLGKSLHTKPHGQATNEHLTAAKQSCEANGVSFSSCERMSLLLLQPEEDKTSQMSPGLKAAIGNVASKLKQFMEKAYPGRAPNQLRERLFGGHFAAIWGDECTCDYEFVDFFCESGSMLGRHMDCLNGNDEGCDFVASCSCCVSIEDGKECQQNIIMTHRSWCDANMSNLEKEGIDNAKLSRGCCLRLLFPVSQLWALQHMC